MKLTDYEMVSKIKEGKDHLIERLYNRYVPFLWREGGKLRQYGFTQDDVEDFVQDGYSALIKALDYVDLNKVYDSNWKFLHVFQYFTNNVFRDYLSRDRYSFYRVKENTKRPTHYEKLNEGSLTFGLNKMVDMDAFINSQPSASKVYFRGQDMRITLDMFEKRLEPRRRKIFQLRRKGYKLEEIGEQMGFTSSRAGQINDDIKQSLKSFLEKGGERKVYA